ncbi:hypothetical protein HHX47_DHR5000019 [Lentinula edodes]|nr:hypothetical protein HHX47_DHR5000019 [Lentinula edodes]
MPSLSSTPSTTFSSLYLHPTPQSILTSLDAQFTLPPALLTDLTHAFLREINLGLKGYGEDMAMVPSFITGVPDGSETGTFLALDLGGTNLRVCQVTLNGDKTFKLRQQKYKVSEGLKTGEAGVLFDYLADSVDAFLTMHPPESPESLSPPLDPNPNPNAIPDVLPLGLTFSFPVEQTALGAGTILTWTKGFSAKNAIGHDVVRLLQDAFDRKHLHVRCVALVNDTVGAMLSRAYTSGGCILGAIFGTGTNGAYLERVENIPKLTLTNPSFAENKDNTGYMVVNTEWGAFNNTRTHLPYTPFDTALDRTSINPRAQAFEKFISGMYLGELTRGVLVALVDAVVRGDVVGGEQARGESKQGTEVRLRKTQSLLFNGISTRVLNEKWALDTSVMSEVEEAWEGGGGLVGEGTTLEGLENGAIEGGGGGGGEGTTTEGNGTTDITNGSGGIGILNGGVEGTPNEIGENPLWDGDDSGGLPDWEFLSGLDSTTTTTTSTPTTSTTPSANTNTNSNTTNTTTTNPSSANTPLANTALANTNTKLRTKLERVRQVVVRRLGYEDGEVRLRDAAIVRWVCHLVARRAALLSGVAVAAVLIQTGRAGVLGGGEGEEGEGVSENENGTMNGTMNGNGTNGENGKKTDEEKIGVGVDGSLIQHYPHFERTMRESLRSIVGAAVERRVEIGLAKDGSGVGAALCALQALKQQQLQPQQPQLQ